MLSIFIRSRNSKHAHIQDFATFINFTIPQYTKHHKFTKITNAGFTICECSQTYDFHQVINSTKRIEISISQKTHNHPIHKISKLQFRIIHNIHKSQISHLSHNYTTLSKPRISRIHATRNSNLFTKSQNSKHSPIRIYITFINFTKPHFHNITTSTVLRILQNHKFAIFRIFRNLQD